MSDYINSVMDLKSCHHYVLERFSNYLHHCCSFCCCYYYN